MTANKVLGWFCVIVGVIGAMGALGHILQALGSWQQPQPTYQLGVAGLAFSILVGAGLLWLGIWLLRTSASTSLTWIAKGLGWFCTVLGVLICVANPIGIVIDRIRASADGLQLPEYNAPAIVASEVLGAGLLWLGVWLVRTAKASRLPARPDDPLGR